MKAYSTYQCLDVPQTERDFQELGSPFWNEGKWNNFVAPFLSGDASGLILVDMGCNAGLFLKLAEDRGFDAVGVDSSSEAVARGIEWRDRNGGNYRIIKARMEDSLDSLPVADYTVLANSHYYFRIEDWLDYLDGLRRKTAYCIVVTDEKKFLNRCHPSSDIDDIRGFFRDWEEVGFIDALPQAGPHARKLRSLCFRSGSVARAAVDSLDSSNHVQDRFYGQLDSGMNYKDTGYYRILKKYRAKWTEDYLNRWVERKVALYQDVKDNGLKRTIIVDAAGRILDGNHRYSMWVHLGHQDIFVRRV
jgi:hypothetical protein